MLTPYETEPRWKMPDDEIIPHNHYVCLKMDFPYANDEFSWGIYHGNLREYYAWADNNKIEMEHNLLILGREIVEDIIYEDSKALRIYPGKRIAKNVKVMFVFWSEKDAKRFEKRWKE